MNLNPLDIDEWDSLIGKSCADFKLSDVASEVYNQLDDDFNPSDVPLLKQNFGCIVAGIALRHTENKLEVLLIQESKSTYRGKWYLPAGRVEHGETLKDALLREVKEEAGLHCLPTRLISVEQREFNWFRTTSLIEITGGNLKTTALADGESLQAKWFPIEEVFSAQIQLRGADILRLIKRATEIFQKSPSSTFVPAIRETPCLHHGWNLIIVNTELNKMILRNDESGDHLPHFAFSWAWKILFSPVEAAAQLTSKGHEELTLAGVVNVCCNFQPAGQHDGIGVSLLLIHSSPLPGLNDGFYWRPVTKALETHLIAMRESLAGFIIV